MNNDDGICQALAYIDEHLEATLTLTSVAAQAGYSRHYFARRFKECMGVSVMEYVRKRRLCMASDAIAKGSRVIDAAFQYGWDSHAGFTKAFKAEYGFSPVMLKMMRSHLDYLEKGAENGMLTEVNQGFCSKEGLYQRLVRILADSYEDYVPQELKQVYAYSCAAYTGLFRYSGEEYVTHPLCAAIILAEMNAPVEAVYAGLFCDVLKKTGLDRQELKNRLPAEVAELVLRTADFQMSAEGLEIDEEAALIKLAERLHNMRTMQYLGDEHRKKKVQETIQFFVPLAERIKNEGLVQELKELAEIGKNQ